MMEPLLVDTEIAARTLALQIRDHDRTRPLIVVGVDEDGSPIVSANRLADLISPRIAVAPEPDLITKHLGETEWRSELKPHTVNVYLPGAARGEVVARGAWSEKSEDDLRRMLSVGEGLTVSIFRAWLARCRDAPAALPPFALTNDFIHNTRAVPRQARTRLADACVDVLLDTSERTSVPIRALPSGITSIERTRDGQRFLLSGVGRSDSGRRKPRGGVANG